MAKGELRDVQLARLIGEELELILQSASDERLTQLTVTRVEPGNGSSHFVVCIAPSEDADPISSIKELKSLLEHASGFLRSQLAEAMNLKRMPELTLMPDPLYALR